MRCHEDGVFLGAILVTESVISLSRCHVFGGTAHVVHTEYKTVGLILVIILGHREVNLVFDAATREFEVVL